MAVRLKTFGEAPLKILDGDRGHQYPKKAELHKEGFCLFLNTSNVTATGFDFGLPEFITQQKDSLLRKGKLQRNDVVMTTRGTVGNSAFYGESVPYDNIRINSGMVILRAVKEELDPYFLYCFLRSEMFEKQTRSLESGSAQPQLPIANLRNVAIPLPSFTKQREIAKVLSSIDVQIELNNQINEELEGMAKLLYDYWFVQFDFPITADQAAAMDAPELEGKPYHSSGGKRVYNKMLKREMPEGWKCSTIGKTFKTHLGGTPSKARHEYWSPGEVNWLSSGENPNLFVLAPDERISELGLQSSPVKLLPAGSVIISIVRHLRASVLGVKAATNQSVVGIVETESLKHCFVYPYLIREIPRLVKLRTGAQQPHINKGVLDESPLVIPDETTLRNYTRQADPLFAQIENCTKQNQQLIELRDWLLPMLMNGQITIG